MVKELTAEVRFETTVPCPAAAVHYGVYLPEQVPPLPEYRRCARERFDGFKRDHRVTLDIERLLGVGLDAAGIGRRGGGVIVYRIEIYDPRIASAAFFDHRFEFRGDELVPTVIKGPFVDLVTESTAVISWDSDRPVRGTVFVGSEPFSPAEGSPATHFEVPVTGLKPGKTHPYHVEITSGGHTTSTRDYWFRTPKRGLTSLKFAVMGDSRSTYGGGEADHGGVNRRVLSRLLLDAFHRGARFIVHTGDLVDGYTTSALEFEMQLAAFKNAVEPVGHYLPIYELMGNHDVVIDVYEDGSRRGVRFDKSGRSSSEALFARSFVNPENGPRPAVQGAPPYEENVYYFDYGNCRFIVLNSNYWWSEQPEKYGGNLEGFILDDQSTWLKQVLSQAANDPRVEHIFLFAHEPMFPNGPHIKDGMWYYGGDPARNGGVDRRYVVERRDELWAAFVATGKAVFAAFGDEHNYCRTLITPRINPRFERPAWEIISGGAGAPFYDQVKDLPWTSGARAFSAQAHYCLVEVEGSKVKIKTYGYNGQLIDRAVLTEFDEQ